MKIEIGFFFCENCGHEVNKDVPYEQKPEEDCPRCRIKSWIFEPTGEVDKKPCTHKDANGEWTVIIIDGQYEQCTQCGLMGK